MGEEYGQEGKIQSSILKCSRAFVKLAYTFEETQEKSNDKHIEKIGK